ncbi:major allergen I polypeptide chain 1-like, partial [Oryx dammah]|uniref:major allergen I polypeptide chain 1-like n=1 Tax=Oryx dammah TaxID=59534 RepID=UPI001A9AD5EA
MTRAGALLLLSAALLLIEGGKRDDICPALRDTVDLFISGSHEAYIEQLEKYNQNSGVLETANILKSCTDENLTPQDKQDSLSALVGEAVCDVPVGRVLE